MTLFESLQSFTAYEHTNTQINFILFAYFNMYFSHLVDSDIASQRHYT